MLINCVAYRDGHKLAEIGIEEISSYVSQPDTLVWVALAEPSDAELAKMQQEFGLHELAVEDAQSGHQRPKVEEYGDSLFVVLQTVELDGHELRLGEMNVFVGPDYVLSIRTRTRRGFGDVRARCEREPELLKQGSGFVLYALMDSVVDRYFPVLDRFETELEGLEELMFTGGLAQRSLKELYGLKQRLMTLKHAVAPLLDAVGRLHGGRVPRVCAGTQEYYRDIFDHLQRINQSIESSREMIATAISVSLSLLTLQENQFTKRLAGVAALVAVPTMIAGIYGMNFKHMPELDWTFGYPLALGLMAAIDGYIFYRLRKAGWI
jgi:magnesium transporter